MNRVVITGIGLISPYGRGMEPFIQGVLSGKTCVRNMTEWENYRNFNSTVAAPAELFGEKDIPRRKRRSMGRMAIFAVQAAEDAISDSGLSNDFLTNGDVGCIIGSTIGSPEALAETFEIIIPRKDISEISSMDFFKFVSHTASMNVAQYFGISGILMATNAACASSLQAIGTGYDLIRLGRQKAVICGGAEEVHPTVTGTFDVLFATSSKFNKTPELTPRPFDRDRDGVVCGEGSAVLILEEYEHALKRGAKIYAEVIGYNTCGSGNHISESDRGAMKFCILGALKDAGIGPKSIDLISAHATGTIQGDIEEAEAIKDIFGSETPVSCLKGYIGHTLGASGSMELAVSLDMMKNSRILPTINLDNIDEKCAGINIIKQLENKNIDIVMKNSFAFGGINAVVVCKKI